MSKCDYCLQMHDGDCKKEDLLKALDLYENRRFMNQMVDRWSAENYAFDSKMLGYIYKIKSKLEVIGNENTNNS